MILTRWLWIGLVLGMAHAVAAPPRLVPQGERIRGPQVVADAAFDLLDWNDDGTLDFYFPWTSMNNVMIHLNYGTKTEPRLGHAFWYPLNITETVPHALYFTQTHILGDLNSDGLWDIIYYDGQFRMAYNTGTRHGPNHWHLAGEEPYFPGSPEFLQANTRQTVTPESMYWGKGVFPRQVLTATLADWDGDGLLDLIVCRFKGEAPGVALAAADIPLLPASVAKGPTWLEKLDAAPPRELFFYKNTGTKEKPWFDKGIEISTPDGQSIAAANPVVVDFDGDGKLDIVSTETLYRCNAYRVDWPTNPHVVWFRGQGIAKVAPAQPVLDAAGKPIAAGTQVRFADYRGVGAQDMFVLDPNTGLRWYQKETKGFAAPRSLTGHEFARFAIMYHPVVTDWEKPGSRDLILHGEADGHCRWGLRRTALYRNVATRPGELKYEFGGFFNYQGDPWMVPYEWPYQDREHDLFGSTIGTLPPDSQGGKRFVLSVAGRLYLFRKLAADGLTFQERVPLNLPNPGRNRRQGWQDIPVNVAAPVRFIRLDNPPRAGAMLRSDLLRIVNFEALVGGKNVATLDHGAKARLQDIANLNPDAMLTPGNTLSDTQPTFTTLGGSVGAGVVELKEPVRLEKIRFLLADRNFWWYTGMWPISWHGRRVGQQPEPGQIWYEYTVEVSADGENWTRVADTRPSELNRSTPVFVDWDGDGKLDLVLGVMNEHSSAPHEQEYRLYLNQGTNDDPKFVAHQMFCDETGAPLRRPVAGGAVSPHSSVAVLDRHGDGSRYDLVVPDSAAGNSLRFYENVSADPRRELKFKFVKLLGDGRHIAYIAPDRQFSMGDADGDGVVDLLYFTGCPLFFKGIAAGAPTPVADLTVVGVNKASVELQWTRPKGAARYELRHAAPDQQLESDWTGLPVVTGDYTAAEGSLQTARVTIPADGLVWSLAVKSANAKTEWSAKSDWTEAVAGPWTRVVLRNGPAGGLGVPEYAGTQGGMVSAQYPARPISEQRAKFQVYLHRDNKPAMVLIRFTDLPRLAKLERATLELTTDPELLARAWLRIPGQLDVTVNAIRDDWDPGTASFAEVAPGKPWAPGELLSGGQYLDMARPVSLVTARHVLRWDVTAAVRDALKAGRNSVSLLVRPEFNGFYSHGEEYSFCGTQFNRVEQRPRLSLIGKEL